MNCLWCFESIIQKHTWSTIFTLSAMKGLCPVCRESLMILHTNRCTRCSRESVSEVCSDCLVWEQQGQFLDWNVSVFKYEGAVRDMLYKWKYRGDYELGYAFEREYSKGFAKVRKRAGKNAVIVPVPLSEERLSERGFNQAEMLAGFLKVKKSVVLKRRHSEKQSKKSRSERLASENPFQMQESIQTPVILVDDIYTTGSTLHQAAAVLKQNGAPFVAGYTLIRS